jgi:hypothetical protein
LREISRSEAIAVADLLAGAHPHAGRPVHGPIPRRTRQAIRQRLVAREVIKERYLPDPAVLGRPLVTFAIAQPFAEKHVEAVRAWRSLDSAVDVWSGQNALFAVFFLAGLQELDALRAQLDKPQLHQTLYFLNCDSRDASVPVFLDYEAAWVRITGLDGTLAYPRALPSSSLADVDRPASVPRADREALRSLVLQTPEVGLESGSGGWMKGPAKGMRERRLLRQGMVEFRSFLDPVECSRWASNFPDAVVFVRGTLFGGTGPEALFRALVEECGVSPFLFATDGKAVLFCCLSDHRRDSREPPSSRRVPTLEVMQRFLRQIVVARELLDTLTPVVDHRYDRPKIQTT